MLTSFDLFFNKLIASILVSNLYYVISAPHHCCCYYVAVYAAKRKAKFVPVVSSALLRLRGIFNNVFHNGTFYF